jgi:hypothetical protein
MKNQKKQTKDVSTNSNELTIPDKPRQALTMTENASLNAEGAIEGIIPQQSPSARRKAGYDDLRSARASVRYAGPQLRPSVKIGRV